MMTKGIHRKRRPDFFFSALPAAGWIGVCRVCCGGVCRICCCGVCHACCGGVCRTCCCGVCHACCGGVCRTCCVGVCHACWGGVCRVCCCGVCHACCGGVCRTCCCGVCHACCEGVCCACRGGSPPAAPVWLPFTALPSAVNSLTVSSGFASILGITMFWVEPSINSKALFSFALSICTEKIVLL